MTLRFGTAGLRGPLGDGPDAINKRTVALTTAGLAEWLTAQGLSGGQVVIGHDARHGSASFAQVTAEVLAAYDFPTVQLPGVSPTPMVSYGVRTCDAVAGVQITASHNPAGDNGYKLYLGDGAQLVSPADRQIEAAIDAVRERLGDADVPRGTPNEKATEIPQQYLRRVETLVKGPATPLRIAITPLHGVGGAPLLEALHAVGYDDVHVVTEQYAPDPDFPTAPRPNPEEPGVTDRLLALAQEVQADLAIALDPDADRCAVGVVVDGAWRMLSGNEAGVLLGEYAIARHTTPSTFIPGQGRVTPADPRMPLVATTIVSSSMLAKLAPVRGARFVATLTGFKWLMRADEAAVLAPEPAAQLAIGQPTGGVATDPHLVYAYEEALGMAVDPDAVRDKDGIGAALLFCDLASRLADEGSSLALRLDELAVEFGVHADRQRSLTLTPDEASAWMQCLREHPPTELAGEPAQVYDLDTLTGRLQTDAVLIRSDSARVVVRPSGTEPKIKLYFEVVEPVSDAAALSGARERAEHRLDALAKLAD